MYIQAHIILMENSGNLSKDRSYALLLDYCPPSNPLISHVLFHGWVINVVYSDIMSCGRVWQSLNIHPRSSEGQYCSLVLSEPCD